MTTTTTETSPAPVSAESTAVDQPLHATSLAQLLAMHGLSDIHLSLGRNAPDVWVRLSGVMQRVHSPQACAQLLENTLQVLRLSSASELHTHLQNCGGQEDLALSLAGGERLRNHVFLACDQIELALRLLPSHVPDVDTLGLPATVTPLLSASSGLIFVCGGTGSGKTTTLAALIGHINANQAANIISLEAPIEYIHKDQRSRIRQRSIGPHGDCHSFAQGVVAAMREDPDVILVGEVRDQATMHACLQAAQTGHLVLATLHTNSAPETIDRALAFYPEAERDLARSVLSSSLRAIVAQRLLPQAAQPTQRVLACEVLLVNQGIRANIAAGQITQIAQTMETGRSMGQQTLNHHLFELVQSGLVTREAALTASPRADMLSRALDARS
ncbi:type IV pilus twitching motility protein PilT [Limnohabitans radicicola]|uniref:PilT/PilU family type 4a pilus ATPase n=1 Tax=Limnohabitans radicicola TaxID=2771427 RepID=A0A927ILU8_9BURK|nr:PilT/PilU family type 4a pilus ATPase [Limnohabitans radicicola]MBD8051083.1 PilT/PilU family type 4a pilus ATPase [Limnohabitans radicicola]